MKTLYATRKALMVLVAGFMTIGLAVAANAENTKTKKPARVLITNVSVFDGTSEKLIPALDRSVAGTETLRIVATWSC